MFILAEITRVMIFTPEAIKVKQEMSVLTQLRKKVNEVCYQLGRVAFNF